MCKIACTSLQSETWLLSNNVIPISLFSNVVKIIEKKLIHLRLNLFLETRNCYYPFQFAFRLNFLTNNAVMGIAENAQTQLDDGKDLAGAFFDLKTAFETVDQNILLKELDYCGVRGIANKWFELFQLVILSNLLR